MKTKLIPKCQNNSGNTFGKLTGRDGLPTTNLTEWTSDSVAKYKNLYPFATSNFRSLNDNLLYSEEYDDSERREQGMSRLETDAKSTLERSKDNCLGSTLNWNSNKIAPLFGVTPFRLTTEHFWLPGYKGGAYQIPEASKHSSGYSKGKAPSSWNFARTYADAGYGRMVKYDSNVSYPVGTIFNIGNASGIYIPKEYDKDEYGNPYSSHSYTLTGFDVDKEGKSIPIYYDYGNIGHGNHVLYERQNPTYAFIPYGYEHLTAENIVPKYMKWKKRMNTNLEVPKIKGQNKVNKTYLNIDPKELQALTEYYGFGNASNILKRVMAIGAQESRLGYNLEGEDFKAPLIRQAKYYLPNQYKSRLKLGAAVSSFIGNYVGNYDNKAGYEHEIDIYKQLKKQGKLKGLTPQQIYSLVVQQYKKEAKGKHNYGKRAPSYEIFNNSKGAFQIKGAPDNLQNFRNIKGKLIKKGGSFTSII